MKFRKAGRCILHIRLAISWQKPCILGGQKTGNIFKSGKSVKLIYPFVITIIFVLHQPAKDSSWTQIPLHGTFHRQPCGTVPKQYFQDVHIKSLGLCSGRKPWMPDSGISPYFSSPGTWYIRTIVSSPWRRKPLFLRQFICGWTISISKSGTTGHLIGYVWWVDIMNLRSARIWLLITCRPRPRNRNHLPAVSRCFHLL